MRRLLTRIAVPAVVAALLALPLFSASAVVPIPVDTSLDTAGWSNGVYVQPSYQGRGPAAEVVLCHIHVQTIHNDEVQTVGETMTATDGGQSYQAEVNARSIGGTVLAGRATFTVDPGVTLTTTNTDPSVSGTCPGGEQVE